ncbi:hypothetical protein MRX96_056706 [Rhipicephalus microplus]
MAPRLQRQRRALHGKRFTFFWRFFPTTMGKLFPPPTRHCKATFLASRSLTGSRASLVPHRTARERTAERQEIQARGDNLEQCDRQRTNHILSSRGYPRGVPAAPRTGTDLRRTTKVVTEQSSSSSTSSSSSLTPPPEFLAPGSRSDERRMLAQPHFQVSAPKVHRPLAEHVEGPPGLPVDAVVNSAVPLQGSGGKRRRSQIKRCVLCSVLSLVVVTGILAVLTWSILEDPLGGDAQRDGSYVARLVALLGAAKKNGDGTVQATGFSVAVNGSVNAFTARTPQAQPGTDKPVRLF